MSDIPTDLMPDFIPTENQQIALNVLNELDCVGLYLGMGAGKTGIVLKHFCQKPPIGNVLIIAPSNIAKTTWPQEIQKWTPWLKMINLSYTAKGGRIAADVRDDLVHKAVTADPAVYVISKHTVATMVQNLPKDDQGRIIWPFPNVIIDESQGIKNAKSGLFTSLASVRPAMTRVIELSGTPEPQDKIDLWSQVYMLDMGARLGADINDFHITFCKKKVVNRDGRTTWIFDDQYEKQVNDLISDIVISTPEETLTSTLNPPIDVPITLSDEVMRDYRKMRRDSVVDIVAQLKALLDEEQTKLQASLKDIHDETTRVATIAEFQVNQMAISSQVSILITPDGEDLPVEFDVTTQSMDELHEYMQMDSPYKVEVYLRADQAATLDLRERQFASGSLYVGEKHEFVTIHEEKLRAAKNIILNTKENVLIAYHFRSEKEMLLKYLSEHGINVRWYDGKPATQDEWNEGKIQALLIQPQSAGHGLNLQFGGRIMIWFTLPNSLESYDQANKRLHRRGQVQDVFIFRLLAQGTIDTRKMVGRIATKQARMNRTLDHIRRQPELF